VSLDSAIKTAVGGMIAQGTVLGVTANNIANLGTAGYKRGIATIGSGVSQIPEVFLRRDTSQGAIAPTGNPNDVAINGPGYFEVALAGGGVAYTRNGQFGLSANASMVDMNGNPVLGPIQTDPAGGPVSVSKDGVVSQTVNGVKIKFHDKLAANKILKDHVEPPKPQRMRLEGRDGGPVEVIDGLGARLNAARQRAKGQRSGSGTG